MAFSDIRLRPLSAEFAVRLTDDRGRYDRSLNGYEMADTGVYNADDKQSRNFYKKYLLVQVYCVKFWSKVTQVLTDYKKLSQPTNTGGQ